MALRPPHISSSMAATPSLLPTRTGKPLTMLPPRPGMPSRLSPQIRASKSSLMVQPPKRASTTSGPSTPLASSPKVPLEKTTDQATALGWETKFDSDLNGDGITGKPVDANSDGLVDSLTNYHIFNNGKAITIKNRKAEPIPMHRRRIGIPLLRHLQWLRFPSPP